MNKIEVLLKNEDLLDIDKFKMYLKILKAKEYETYRHSVRVSKYSVLLAKDMGASNDMICAIWLSGLLHDLGKILVPNYVLLGTDKLSADDYIFIREHPIDGFMYLSEFTSNRVSLGAIEHHERLDGKGYPYGVSDISIIGRIIAICDTFDAMTSDRTYQSAMSFELALDKMDDLSNEGLYDKDILLKFKKMIKRLNSANTFSL